MKKLLLISLLLCGCAAYQQRRDVKKLDALAIQQPAEFARLSNMLNPCFSGKAKSDTIITTHVDTLVKEGSITTVRIKDTVYVTKTLPARTINKTHTVTIHDTIPDNRGLKELSTELKVKSDSTLMIKTQMSKLQKDKNTWMWMAIGLMVLVVGFLAVKIYLMFWGGGIVKKLLVIILVFAGVNALGQQQVIKYPGYTAYYNPQTLIPDSVIWLCKPHTKVVGRENGFHATGGRPNLTQYYRKSGYDIGHNTDASDENGDKADEYNSFDFCNTYPQRPLLNRRVWLALEEQCRKLSQKYGSVKVKVSWRGASGKVGPITIPAICIKDVWYNGRHEHYEMPNCDTVIKHTYTYYLK